MKTKLTLRLDDDLIERAKTYASGRGESLSQMVADYFIVLTSGEAGAKTGITPRVRSMLGILKGTGVTEGDYHRYLEEKHR